MKHGDQVKKPLGLGVFFRLHEDITKAYVVLKNPTDKTIYIPLVEVGFPVWECFACDTFNIVDLTVDKTLEQRQIEAQEAARRTHAQKEAYLRQKMQEFQEAQMRQHAEQKDKSQN